MLLYRSICVLPLLLCCFSLVHGRSIRGSKPKKNDCVWFPDQKGKCGGNGNDSRCVNTTDCDSSPLDNQQLKKNLSGSSGFYLNQAIEGLEDLEISLHSLYNETVSILRDEELYRDKCVGGLYPGKKSAGHLLNDKIAKETRMLVEMAWWVTSVEASLLVVRDSLHKVIFSEKFTSNLTDALSKVVNPKNNLRHLGVAISQEHDYNPINRKAFCQSWEVPAQIQNQSCYMNLDHVTLRDAHFAVTKMTALLKQLRGECLGASGKPKKMSRKCLKKYLRKSAFSGLPNCRKGEKNSQKSGSKDVKGKLSGKKDKKGRGKGGKRDRKNMVN